MIVPLIQQSRWCRFFLLANLDSEHGPEFNSALLLLTEKGSFLHPQFGLDAALRSARRASFLRELISKDAECAS